MVCLNIVDNANLSIVATRLPLRVQHIATTFTLTSPDTSHMTPLSRQTSPSSPQLIIIHAGPSSNHLKALRKQRWFWMAAILHCLKKHLKHDFDHGGTNPSRPCDDGIFFFTFVFYHESCTSMQLGDFWPNSRSALQWSSNKNRTATNFWVKCGQSMPKSIPSLNEGSILASLSSKIPSPM